MTQQHTIRQIVKTTFERKASESRVKGSDEGSRVASGILRSKILRVAGELAWGLKPTMPYSMSNTVK